jgi:hypothetical protein
VDAETEGLTGQAAALELVTWEHADVEIADGCPVQGPAMESTLSYLLMEGMRLKDERERDAATPPSSGQETGETIETPLSDRLRRS